MEKLVRPSYQEVLSALEHMKSKSSLQEFKSIHKLSAEKVDGIPVLPKSARLNELLEKILNAKKMIEFSRENSTDTLAVYYYNKEMISVSTDDQNFITIFPIGNKDELKKRMAKFYEVDLSFENNPVEVNIGITEEDYDRLHSKTPDELTAMIQDEKVDKRLQRFLLDFKNNHQKADRINFKMKERTSELFTEGSVLFFVPGEKNIWHIKYDEIESGMIYLMSNSIAEYFTGAELLIEKFLEEEPVKPQLNKPAGTKKIDSEKFFSIKRGFSFFYKSNIAVVIGLLCFFINQSSWVEQGGINLFIVFILTESFLLLLSLIACFKEKEEKAAADKRLKTA
ncbi:hypothetical protein [Bacillus sp. P14.5]|uniref:hypothetical protein n=1 Tax=Bacillus sp. P14.5 TaxID=1983400 RepID=UPI000DE85EB5|nr:hypothetical protein [Bacillus sp. P14.5]